MRILVTGANGQVGSEFAECAKVRGNRFEIVGLGRRQLDITLKSNIEDVLANQAPDIIVNTAAYTAVDKAEEEIAAAYAINRDGAGYLAEVCAARDIPLIHISTDYVFDGSKTGAYLETDTVNPVSVYGKSKLEGERHIRQVGGKYIILRTSWVFGVYGKNFVYSIIRLAKQREELRIVNDQHGCPSSAASIAKAILRICELIAEGNGIEWGVYHYCGSPETNWYDFSAVIVDNTRSEQKYVLKTLLPIPTSEYPTAAVRPKNSVLNCDKIRRQFGIEQQPWVSGLRDMIKHPRFLESTN